MNLIDRIILEWSYRTKKGYPDLNNEDDLVIFESTFGFSLNEEVANKANTIKAVKAIVNNPKNKEFGLAALPSKPNRLSAPGIKNDEDILKAIRATFGEDVEIEIIRKGGPGNPSRSFSMLRFIAGDLGEVNIVVSSSAVGGAGIGNEQIVVDTLNSQIEAAGGRANITITSPERSRTYNNVTRVDKVGTTAGKGMKADIQLLDGNNVLANISIKQDGGFRWESVNNDSTPVRANFIRRALEDPTFPIELKPIEGEHTDLKPKYHMYRPDGRRLTKVVIKGAPVGDNDKFAFGEDNPKTIIVGRTFKPEDFKANGNNITVDVSSLYTNMDEIPESLQPVFAVMQHVGQKYALDFRIIPKYTAKISANGIEIDYKEVIK